MGDHDWELWQSAWQGVNGALPDVKARASAASARHRLDSVLLAVVLGAGTIGAATGVATGGPATQLVCAGNIAFTALFLAAYFLIQRDLGRARDSAPREAVAFLERRVRLERRTAQLARWMTLAMLAFLFAFGDGTLPKSAEMDVVRQLLLAGFVAVGVITFTAPWWVGWRLARYDAELARMRSWLDEQGL